MHRHYSIAIDGTQVCCAVLCLSTFEIVSLATLEAYRRRGYARRVMKMVCDQADREGVMLMLQAAGSPAAMSTEQLETWYKRFGFVFQSSGFGYREPRRK